VILNHELVLVPRAPASLPSSLSSEKVCHDFLASNNKNSKERLFYIAGSGKHKDDHCDSLLYPIYLVQENFDGGSLVATTWVEDEELGRGYLLLSTSAGNGKIYRWEAGGGPIAIGRTLHLKDSGCRSNLYSQCSTDPKQNMGSGGIAIDSFQSEGYVPLMVAEYGEGRVVRLEENGARTPLITEIDDEGHRLVRPFRLLVTPYGDLMAMDNATTRDKENQFVLWRLPKASGVPALPSLSVSRKAHAWKRNNSTSPPLDFFRSEGMGGMVLDPSGQRIYVTTTIRRMGDSEEDESSSVVVVSLPLLDDLDDNENQDSTRTLNFATKLQSGVVFDYADYANAPGAIEVDNNGNLYLAVDNGVLVVSKSKSLIAKIAFEADEKIMDLTLGSDKFLYIAMESKLARVRVPNSPLQVKKDLILKA